MSVSNGCSEEFLKRFKEENNKKKRRKCLNDKENNPKDMNNDRGQSSESKPKKYRFIPAFKVAEVVRVKKEEEEKDRMVVVDDNELSGDVRSDNDHK